MTKILDFVDVELYYEHVYALKGVSLSVNQGETIALIGANGAGKSSILRVITGLAKPVKGSVTFEGERINGTDPAAIVKQGIAMVPEGRLRNGWFVTTDDDKSITLSKRHTHVRTFGPRNGQNASNMVGHWSQK